MLQQTQKRRTHYRISNLIHLALQAGPLIVFSILALCSLESAGEAVKVSTFFLLAIILSVVSLVRHKMSRSSLWLVLLALYFALDYLIVPLVVIASCQVVDELFVRPIRARLKEKYHTGLDVEEYL